MRSAVLIYSITAALCLLPTIPSSAANIKTVWGLAKDQSELKFFSLAYDKNKAKNLQLPKANGTHNPNYSLQFLKGFVDSQSKMTHLRYDQYYQGIRVWGSQIIYHLSSDSKPWVTGMLATDLEADIRLVEHKISADEALAIAVNKYHKLLSAKPKIAKIIYISEEKPNPAVAAYHILYGGTTADDHGLALHEFIINANTGKIISYWNGLKTQQVGGTGPGGVEVSNLPYRVGNYQFGNQIPNVNSLGVMNVDYDGTNTCTISNLQFNVVNLENQIDIKPPFPNAPYSYTCSPPNFTNENDNGFAPINSGISPINDVTYFTQKAFDMYQNIYKIAYPVGSSKSSLPVPSYTHAGQDERAFACPIECAKTFGSNTQFMFYGNGIYPNGNFFPLTAIDIVGHELSHLVTSNFSDLIFQNQSGGIDEAFSDMAGIALQSYVNGINNPFKIWNGPAANAPDAWTIGLSISATNPPKPIRYLNNPPLDGHSIGNAANYRPGMDPHFSSGVFNKAFYLLSTTPGWTVERAFQIMLDANIAYWIPSTNFEYASCGIIQAAANRGYHYLDVIHAFKKVGVKCLVGNSTIVRKA